MLNKISGLENPHLIRGLFLLPDGKTQLYVNRGLGGLKRLRLLSPPEICLLRCIYGH